MCSSSGNVSGVKGVYSFLQGAANASGVTINTTFTTGGDYTKVTCHANASSWVISAPLKTYPAMTKPMFCVDSRGTAKVTDVNNGGTQPAGSAVQCS